MVNVAAVVNGVVGTPPIESRVVKTRFVEGQKYSPDAAFKFLFRVKILVSCPSGPTETST